MKDVGIVQGSAVQAVPLVVGKDTVYVHMDIHEVETDEGNIIWQYHEVQYDKDEYIHLMAEQNSEANVLLNTILGVKIDE